MGVVGDVKHVGLAADPVAEIYYRSARSGRMTYIVRTTGSPDALARTVQAAVEQAAPVKVVDVRALDDLVTASVTEPRFRARLFSLMGLLVGLLALTGVFSVTACAVAQRQREIGIRIALGATANRVVWFILRHAGVPVVAGLAAGLAIATGTNRLLSRFLFETTPFEPATVTTVVLGLAGTAMLAAYVAARRVVGLDPTVTLKMD